MAKLDALDLHEAIGREEFDFVALSSVLAEAYSGVRQKINELLKAETIVRVKKGLYVFGPRVRRRPVCKESLANLIYGPSCISLEYALAYYGLTPERVETVTCVTPKKNKQFDTAIGRFSYKHVDPLAFPHGIDQVWIDNEHPVLMATPEKALCDYIVSYKVPELPSEKAASEFLQSDLRIDQENWKQFDLRQMIRLNKFYQSPVVNSILEIL